MREIEQMTLVAFETLGCCDITRNDFRVDTKGKPYFIEIDPLAQAQPGLY